MSAPHLNPMPHQASKNGQQSNAFQPLKREMRGNSYPQLNQSYNMHPQMMYAGGTPYSYYAPSPQSAPRPGMCPPMSQYAPHPSQANIQQQSANNPQMNPYMQPAQRMDTSFSNYDQHHQMSDPKMNQNQVYASPRSGAPMVLQPQPSHQMRAPNDPNYQPGQNMSNMYAANNNMYTNYYIQGQGQGLVQGYPQRVNEYPTAPQQMHPQMMHPQYDRPENSYGRYYVYPSNAPQMSQPSQGPYRPNEGI